MKRILVIKSSLNGADSQSSQLVDKLTEKFQKNLEADVTTRDLASQPLPHLTQHEMTGWMGDADEVNDIEEDTAALSDELIRELKNSDAVIIGMPMYNFGVPSTFKSWVDRIARAGATFNYTESGPVGLLENKPVYIVATRGGFYAGTPADTQTPYLKSVFGLIGLRDVHFVYAEGLGTSDKDSQLTRAEQAIEQIIV